MEILTTVGEWILPVLGTVLGILLMALIKKGLDKLGIDRSEKLDQRLDDYVGKGVAVAERWARNYLSNNGEKVGSMSKKDKAINVVLRELEQAGVRDVGEQLIADRIEAWLEVNDPKAPESGQAT